jgi:hypothetical protein
MYNKIDYLEVEYRSLIIKFKVKQINNINLLFEVTGRNRRKNKRLSFKTFVN